jgi:hypothetical protein
VAFPSGWTRKCDIAIGFPKVGTGGVSDFTVYLTRGHFPDEMCDPAGGNNAQANGGDIRFSSDAAGATRLACQIDAFGHDSALGADDAVVRIQVKVPSLSDSVDTPIYVWYNSLSVETQPASTDTYGSQNAYDASHCSRWALDEAVGGGAPQMLDSVGARHLTVGGSGSTSVTGQHGNAFDGNGTGNARSGFSGFACPNNASAVPFTNTGLCYIPADDCLAATNFDDGQIVEINKSTGAEITSFSLVTNGPADPQGVAWNPTAARYAVRGITTAQLWLYQRNGTFDSTISYTGDSAVGAVAYDFTDDVYWVASAAGEIRSINTGTGATVSTVTLAGGAASVVIEGITHNVTDNTLFITTDTGNMIYEVNKTTGGTIASFRGPYDIEHPAYDHGDDTLWCNGDARFHSGGTAHGENVIYKLTPDGQPWDWKTPTNEFSLEWWWKPDNVGSTAIALSEYSAIESAAFYLEVQTRATGVVRVLDSTTAASVDTAGSTLATGSWSYWRLTYDDAANTLTLFKANSQVSQLTSAAYSRGPDGRFCIGSRVGSTFFHNGAIDEVRFHNSKRASAWWTTRYNNTSDPATFATVGTPAVGDLGASVGVLVNGGLMAGRLVGRGRLVA